MAPEEQDHPATAPVPAPAAGRAGRNLPAAIGVGVGLLAVVVVTLAWFNWGFVIFVAVALSLGVIEVSRALQRLGMNAAIWPILVGTVVIVVGSYWAERYPHNVISSNAWLLAALGFTVVAALIWRMPGGADGFVRDAAASLFVIAYLPLMGSFVALMLAESLGSRRLVCYLLAVIASDIGGYTVGSLIGRHQMAPHASPKKTWEGLGGSVGFGMILAMASMTPLLHLSWWVSALLGAVLVGVGTCGDLVESLIKRDVGIKDMSHVLPGHGGVMDRLDSLVFAAPVAWLAFYLVLGV